MTTRETDAVITAFLEAAAEEGWHMRPDVATEEMILVGKKAKFLKLDLSGGYPEKIYHAMQSAAPEFNQ